MVGEAGVCSGISGSSGLRWSCHHEHARQRVGFARASCRRSQIGGAQLAIDTTLVSVLHCDGTARPRTANEDGVVLAIARRRKERTCLELVGPHARLVVLAGEVAGRWSEETRSFVSQAFASSLLNLKAGGADGETPCSHEVMGDFRMSEIDMV